MSESKSDPKTQSSKIILIVVDGPFYDGVSHIREYEVQFMNKDFECVRSKTFGKRHQAVQFGRQRAGYHKAELQIVAKRVQRYAGYC